MSKWDRLELVSLIALAVAVLFLCWVLVRPLLDHHDPDVPTHSAPQEIHADA